MCAKKWEMTPDLPSLHVQIKNHMKHAIEIDYVVNQAFRQVSMICHMPISCLAYFQEQRHLSFFSPSSHQGLLPPSLEGAWPPSNAAMIFIRTLHLGRSADKRKTERVQVSSDVPRVLRDQRSWGGVECTFHELGIWIILIKMMDWRKLNYRSQFSLVCCSDMHPHLCHGLIGAEYIFPVPLIVG